MPQNLNGTSPTKSAALAKWVAECAQLTQPDRIVWCDGSEAERDRFLKQAISEGVLIPLNPDKRPGCYLHRSNPNDVARVEQLTFICTKSKELAGPTNNGMGPVEAPFAKVGIELTDSIYVVLNMRIMTRMGRVALHRLGDSTDFNKG